MRGRVFLKLLGLILLVIGVSTAALDLMVRRSWEQSLEAQLEQNLKEKVQMFASRVEHRVGPETFQQLADEVGQDANARATIIDHAGQVLADSRAVAGEMENHATRPEFIAAFHGEIGVATRTSHTLGIEFLYVAAPTSIGAVRLAYPLSQVRAASARVRRQLVGASLVALAVGFLIALIAAESVTLRLRKIVAFAQQVEAGNLGARLPESGRDEIALVAAALDRTARQLEANFRELENNRQQLETLLNSMEDAVVAVSAAREVAWFNGAMSRLTGSRIAIGVALIEVIRDPGLLEAVEQVIKTGKGASGNLHSFIPGRTFDVTAGPLPNGGVVCVLRDRTEIERVERTRRDFIANVSHELRTPLTSLLGYTETLLDSSANGQQREFLAIIQKNAQHMSRLTEDLLTLARVESGEDRLELTALPASTLLESARSTLAGLAADRGIELRVAEAIDDQVTADPDAIQQVFTNLIDNALKYAAGGDRIEIGARPREHGVEFFVRDFGPGIASEHLLRLFERFYRIDRARSREAGGTGLGLAIVKHIVRNHGGQVSVSSELGHGSTFTFTLPSALTVVGATRQ
jgi:two-component system, OmpR family, phosphate regulon sensor histidine kinase PhoR